MTTARGVLRAAVMQVNASNDLARNIDVASRLCHQASSQGAQMVFMPENIALMEWGRANILGKAFAEDDHPALRAFRQLARELGLWLHCGTLHVLLPDDPLGRAVNRTVVIDDQGDIVARYDKIHMFDVDLGNGESYRESATFCPGEQAVVVTLPWGKLGLAVCYDLRFPHLFRQLAQAGAELLTIPAAFTKVTGTAHWHVLQRARAIETGCWVVSPAQVGDHANKRQTYGHALVVDPWGQVVADAGEAGETVCLVDLDLAAVAEARGKIPSLSHDRAFSVTTV